MLQAQTVSTQAVGKQKWLEANCIRSPKWLSTFLFLSSCQFSLTGLIGAVFSSQGQETSPLWDIAGNGCPGGMKGILSSPLWCSFLLWVESFALGGTRGQFWKSITTTHSNLSRGAPATQRQWLTKCRSLMWEMRIGEKALQVL